MSRIDVIEPTPNDYDHRGPAWKITLSCGHWCIVTGDYLNNRVRVPCKICGESPRETDVIK